MNAEIGEEAWKSEVKNQKSEIRNQKRKKERGRGSGTARLKGTGETVVRTNVRTFRCVPFLFLISYF
jgi:hypothetical protein